MTHIEISHMWAVQAEGINPLVMDSHPVPPILLREYERINPHEDSQESVWLENEKA